MADQASEIMGRKENERMRKRENKKMGKRFTHNSLKTAWDQAYNIALFVGK